MSQSASGTSGAHLLKLPVLEESNTPVVRLYIAVQVGNTLRGAPRRRELPAARSWPWIANLQPAKVLEPNEWRRHRRTSCSSADDNACSCHLRSRSGLGTCGGMLRWHIPQLMTGEVKPVMDSCVTDSFKGFDILL